ncbi:MAG: crossover junction endodeoxyribonuclease RuvC [Gammaproteobacteria bacterium]|nr:crossover junction endodeoxyribonuclease RuvC [Gammaproteobacteria bacterium]MYF37421.1 crossover junction endodeoxyribonuclease RuvC [Gammaproteobacteria bacterium]
MKTVIGIDPGSRTTGYGLIAYKGTDLRYIASGCIKTQQKSFFERLRDIYDGVDLVLSEYTADVCAVEGVFMADNPNSALKLGQARGAALAAVLSREVTIVEHSARQVKKVLVGTGKATKQQVQYMVKNLLRIDGTMSTDASDALAIAICHVYSIKTDTKSQHNTVLRDLYRR